MIDEEDIDILDDDVPVYEPMYPDAEYECDHRYCDNDSEHRSRICEHCVPVMDPSKPAECPYCGASRKS